MKMPSYRPACLRFAGATLLGTLLAVSARADYPSTVVSQGPAGYWRLNETVQPPVLPINATNRGSLGSAGDGSLLAGTSDALLPTRGQLGALTGSTDTSYFFSNPGWTVTYFGSHVDVANNAALNPNGPFTVEFWAKPSTAPGDLFSPVCSLDAGQNGGNSREGYLFYIDGTASRWQFRIGGFGGYATNASGGSFTAGAWHHIVGVYDGSAITLYVNGVAAATAAVPAGTYTPNGTQPFRIGATTIPNRTFNGYVDEVAVYGTALSAATIKAHFDAASNNGAGYANQILASSPVGYWRLGEPGDPPAANLGTLGSAANASYVYNSHPGGLGIRPPTYPGLDAGNNAVSFDGSGGYVSVPALNFNTNTLTITGWIKANGGQAPGTGLILNRGGTTTAAGLAIDVAGGLGLTYNWANDNATYNWASLLLLPDSDWAFVALVIQPDQAAIFEANDTNYTTFTGATNPVTHAVQDLPGTTLFGADLAPNVGSGPAYFNGSIDEVAIFERALGVGEIYSQYAAAIGGVPPQIFGGPNAPANQLFDGDTLSLSVDAGGTPALGYQWRRGGAAISGATASAFVKTNLQVVADSGSYDVVITNAFGAVTSAPVSITVTAVTAPAITQNPVGRTLYAGGTLNLSVVASGGQLAYQWQQGNNPIPGATGSAYVVPSVVAGNAGSYTVTVTNRLGSASSTPPAVVTIITPTAGTFEATIVGDKPEAWWRLDETAGATVMADGMGRHDGTYVGNVTLGSPGVVASGGDTAVTFDGSSYGTVPYSSLLNTKVFTVEAWAKAVSLTDTRVPVSSHYSSKGWWFWTAVPTFGQWSGGVSVGGGDYYVPTVVPAASMQTNVWTHLVLTTDPANGLVIYINGQWDNRGWADFDRNSGGPFIIGAEGMSSGQVASSFWKGEVDEVAFYTNSLSLEQVQAHYAAALYGNNTKPVFKLQPQSQIAAVGSQVSFQAMVDGSAPIALQWYKDNALIPSETSDKLSLTNITTGSAGTYQLIATNSVGATASSPATLVVQPVPTSAFLTNGLVLHLKFENNYADSSGLGNDGTANGAPAFIPGIVGTNAVALNTDVVGGLYNYVSIAPTNSLAFGETDSFSVSLWVNYTNTPLPAPLPPEPDDLPIIGNAVNATYQQGWVFSDDAGQFEWTLMGNDFTSVIADPVGGPVIADLKWHNVIVSFDRTLGVANTYIDGVQVDIRSIQGLGSLDNGNPVALAQDPSGKYDPSSNPNFKGQYQIDDVGIWRRVLSTYEAQSIYQAGLAGKSFDVPSAAPPTLSIARQGGGWVITYTGTLQSSATVNGTYSNVPGANSPYTVPTGSAGMQFYRASN